MNLKLYKCQKCGENKTKQDFYYHPELKNNMRQPCALCYIKLYRKGQQNALIAHIKIRAKTKNLKYDLNVQWLIEQGDRCALTGIKFTKNKGYSPYNMSVDRIDNNKGYIQDNCRVVCRCINAGKATLNDDEFFKVCKKVVLHNKKIPRVQRLIVNKILK